MALGFGPLMLLGAYVVQTGGALAWEPFIASIPIALLVALILYVNEIPDRRGDAHAGKRTLPGAVLGDDRHRRLQRRGRRGLRRAGRSASWPGVLPIPALLMLLADPARHPGVARPRPELRQPVRPDGDHGRERAAPSARGPAAARGVRGRAGRRGRGAVREPLPGVSAGAQAEPRRRMTSAGSAGTVARRLRRRWTRAIADSRSWTVIVRLERRSATSPPTPIRSQPTYGARSPSTAVAAVEVSATHDVAHADIASRRRMLHRRGGHADGSRTARATHSIDIRSRIDGSLPGRSRSSPRRTSRRRARHRSQARVRRRSEDRGLAGASPAAGTLGMTSTPAARSTTSTIVVESEACRTAAQRWLDRRANRSPRPDPAERSSGDHAHRCASSDRPSTRPAARRPVCRRLTRPSQPVPRPRRRANAAERATRHGPQARPRRAAAAPRHRRARAVGPGSRRRVGRTDRRSEA